MLLRAVDLAIFILILNASVVFVADVGLFDDNYLEQGDLARNQYSSYTIADNLSGYGNISQTSSTWDYFKTSIVWAVEALIMFVKIVFSVVFIYPVLVKVFGVPEVLSGFLQCGIYFLWILGYAQWKKGLSLKGMM